MSVLIIAQVSSMAGLQNLILHLDTASHTHKQRVGGKKVKESNSPAAQQPT